MYSSSRSSSAYKLDWDYETPRRTEKKVIKSKKIKKKKAKLKLLSSPAVVAFAVFAVFALIAFRSVQIYSLHENVESTTTQLQKATRENEQLTIEINSMIDSAKIASYATENLGLQKIQDRQVIYLSSDGGDVMGKVAKAEEKKGLKGLFGYIYQALEYLK